jgi:shikimate dehydrogenase
MKKLVGLVGGPDIKRYSIADLVWQKISQHADAQFDYEIWSADNKKDLDELVNSLKANTSFVGCNVALPWKAEIIPHSTRQDSFVSLTGLANSLTRMGSEFLAFNTDPIGCHLGMQKYGFNGRKEKVFILGAGGAGSAMAAHMAQEGHSVLINDVVEGKATKVEALARDHNLKIHAVSTEQLGDAIVNVDVIVNATDVGKAMDKQSDPDNSPIDCELLGISRAYMVVEMNYLPIKTKLLRTAERFSKIAVPGCEMLVRQAVETFNAAFDTELRAAAVDTIVSELYQDFATE